MAEKKTTSLGKILNKKTELLEKRIDDLEEAVIEAVTQLVRIPTPKDGAKGAQGGKGVSGAKGDRGGKGDRGKAGRDGLSGLDGRNGLEGREGEKGDAGEKGDDGEKGDTGEAGKTIIKEVHIHRGGGSGSSGTRNHSALFNLDKDDHLQYLTSARVAALIQDGIGIEWTYNAGADTLTGNITIVPIANGGTGEITANAALNAFLPSQAGNSGKAFTTDGTDGSWSSDILFKTVEVAFTAQTSIVVTHNNGYRPLLFVMDESKEERISFKVAQPTVNQFTVTFSSATTGTIVYASSGAASGGDAFPNVIEKSDTYTLLTSDGTVKCTGSGSFTIGLPTAVGVSGKIYRIKHSGTGTITVDADGTEKIDDVLTIEIAPGIAGAYSNLSIQSDNVGWMII